MSGTWHSSTDEAGQPTSWIGYAPAALAVALERIREPLHVVRNPETGCLGAAFGGTVSVGSADAAAQSRPRTASEAPALLATLPPLYPEWLGDRTFCETHGVRFAYIAGAMANGIATPELVIAMARARMLGFFGAGGLGLDAVERGVEQIQTALGDSNTPWGANLIHAPHEPELEAAIANLYIVRGVQRVSASAYMKLTAPLVRYAASGLALRPNGTIARHNHVFAKISRPEVAAHFLAPAPAALLDALVRQGQLTAEEAQLAARVPLATDITAESDSGGHTDNRPLAALLPAIAMLCEEAGARYGYAEPIRVGAAGGLGTPAAVAAAFSLGAAYVLTGSINQACVEAGLSPAGKTLLAAADLADCVMAPSPDMFELGVKVQVLRRGTLFAQRAAQLYDIYKNHGGLDELAPALRERLEKEIFQTDLESVWRDTEAFFGKRNPQQVARAKTDEKHRMALVFRWYVGKSSRWAIAGEASRALDYQIWCGPAMGAFNRWTRGSFLEDATQRDVAQVALNLLEGAAVVQRAQQLRASGLPIPSGAFDFRPRRLQ